MLFGGDYLNEGFSLNYYISLIVFQAYINFIFLLALKESFITVLAKRLALILGGASLILCIVHYWVGISSALLLALVIGKVSLAVLVCPGISVKYRVITLLLFLMPIALNYGLIEIGFFEEFIVCMQYTRDFIWS